MGDLSDFYKKWWVSLENPKTVKPPPMPEFVTTGPPGSEIKLPPSATPVLNPNIKVAIEEEKLTISVEGAVGVTLGSTICGLSVFGALFYLGWRRRRLTTSSAGCPPVVVGDRHNVENPLEQGNLTSQTSVDHRQDMQPGQGVRAFQDAPQNKKLYTVRNKDLVEGRPAAKIVGCSVDAHPPIPETSLAQNVDNDSRLIREYLAAEIRGESVRCGVPVYSASKPGLLCDIPETALQTQLETIDKEANRTLINKNFEPLVVSTPMSSNKPSLMEEVELSSREQTLVDKDGSVTNNLEENSDPEFHGYTNEDVAESAQKLNKMKEFFSSIGRKLSDSPKQSSVDTIPMTLRRSNRTSVKVYQNLNETVISKK